MTETTEPLPADVADEYILGLDLGQSQDFSALVALRKRLAADGKARLTVRGIKRWPLGTLYTQISADVAEVIGRPPSWPLDLAGCTLGVDRTGCGQPVLEMIRGAKPLATIRPIFITAGNKVTPDGRGFNVPKRELVAAVQAALQSRRLEIPSSIPEAKSLEKELLSFKARISTTAHESFEADWREGNHDDLVLALAIAVWLAERPVRKFIAFLGKEFEDSFDQPEESVAAKFADERWGRW